MAAPLPTHPLHLRPLFVAFAISVAMVFMALSGPLLKPYLDVEPLRAVPYGRPAVTTMLDFLLVLGLVRAAGGLSFSAAFKLAGVGEPIGRPLLFAVLVLAPALALCGAWVPLASDYGAADLAWKGLLAPLLEELIARGLAVGALMRLCGWPVWAACVWPALFFGLAHFGQGAGPASVAGITAITAAGGLLFGWLYWRWGFNLWPAIFLHVGLNTLWLVFALGDTALGGWFGNGVRLGTVALAILVTLWLTRRPVQA